MLLLFGVEEEEPTLGIGKCEECGVVQDLWSDEAPDCLECKAYDSVIPCKEQ